MNPLPFVSIALLVLAAAASLSLLRRSGESGAAALTAMLALLGGGLALDAWLDPPPPLGFDASAVTQLAILGASALALLGALAVRRTTEERDRAETHHWESMEAVRTLNDLVSRPGPALEERLDALLRVGCERFRLELGLVLRTAGRRTEVVARRAPDDEPLAGAALAEPRALADRTLAGRRPLAVARTASAEGEIEAWLGAPLRVAGEAFGVLAFASREPARARFTATDKDLLALMAHWGGFEIERAVAAEMARHERETSRARPRAARANARSGGARRAPHALDVNAALRRLDRPLRRLVGPEVELAVTLAPELGPARAARLPLEPLVRSLLLHARDALPRGGRIALETAPLDAPTARWVTLRVRESGGALDAASIARLTGRPAEGNGRADGAHAPPREDGRLALAALRRMLEREGGDLSVDVEPGRATTFTVFLPALEGLESGVARSEAPIAGARATAV